VRALRFALPLSLFATACAARQTPSEGLEWNAPDDTTDARTYDLPPRAQVLGRWTLPADDPWSPYCKYTLITSLAEPGTRVDTVDFDSLPAVQLAMAAGSHLAGSGLPPGTAFVVDLRGAASIGFGVALKRAAPRTSIALVPTFNNWPAPNEIIPAEETLAAMALLPPPHDAGEGPSTPVFLLDAWRLAHRFDEPEDDAYDNRYTLTSADLPDASTLRSRGIDQVVYVVDSRSDTTVEEDDLNSIFHEWEDGGIRIAMVDLTDLLGAPPVDPWGPILVQRDLVVEPRMTVLSGPSFYVRARGGFGGVHARPSVIAVGHGGGVWFPGGGGG
jgi:hypothetical protein